jgi:hypothetical protein
MYGFQSVPLHMTAPWVRSLTGAQMPWIGILLIKYLYFPALVGVVYGAARISWLVLENPFLKFKDRFQYADVESAAVRTAIACLGSST